MRPPTLNIFPSEPMHVEPSSSNSNANMELLSPETSGSRKTNLPKQVFSGSEPSKTVKPERNHGKGPTSSSEHEGPKTPDPKTLRRLAQNREAARKSRLRKKAYIQQLESSRIRLSQMEQELQRARNQGMFFGGGAVMGGEQNIPISMNSITSDIWRIICSLTREVVNGISWKCSWV
ncbi:bZIP transcription factor TGA10-like isoform X8 [Vicia villosa]|uniref:bZIP transcription factor TGA10-like isoform X8 n=1 Tax=Vicia villosa TaxID=3911 RepID=UPI00273C3825|nr:bZIP transcription factor TGA10-like isoform X8 [Vicia villosa]